VENQRGSKQSLSVLHGPLTTDKGEIGGSSPPRPTIFNGLPVLPQNAQPTIPHCTRIRNDSGRHLIRPALRLDVYKHTVYLALQEPLQSRNEWIEMYL
jgi:hypothetical protein